jgi:hypothetical protein
MTGSDTRSQQVSGNREPGKSSRKTVRAVVIVLVVVVVIVVAVLTYTMFGSSHGMIRTPRSELTIVHTDQFHVVPQYSAEFEFGGFSRYVNWSDVKIFLSDANHTVSWLPTTAGLSGGSEISYSCGQNSLGTLSITCNVTDVIGNGIPNSGDTITLTTQSDATFLTTQDYTIWVQYIPENGKICSLTFSGD